ncbi:MAG TPA: Flp pilus assembly protein CpaB, partial [Candidatus Binataceae bacterium]|nr:Flp pilus assembly protein CpaB [Candidatus Binataceae bacterium]
GSNNRAFSKVVLQNVEVLAVAQEVEMQKDEPQVVKVVTLLVSPQEAERLALAVREGTLHLAMRNYNDNKIVLTSGSDVTQMLRAYSLAPDAPVIAPQTAPAKDSEPVRPRARPFEVEIYRNGKSSESVSFINAALNESARPKQGGDFVQASESDGADGSGAGAPVAPPPSPTGMSAAPLPNPNNQASFASRPSNAPVPKTIDVP